MASRPPSRKATTAQRCPRSRTRADGSAPSPRPDVAQHQAGTARGPQPNLKKAPPPPPGAGLWQIFGVARGDSFTLSAVASTKASNRRTGKLSVAVRGGTLTVTESGGCARTAQLSRG